MQIRRVLRVSCFAKTYCIKLRKASTYVFIDQEKDNDEVKSKVKASLEGNHVPLQLRELALGLAELLLTDNHIALVIDIS